MDLATILKNIDWQTVGAGFIVSAIGLYERIKNFISENKELISEIALRIEKDASDGKWTNKEKEDHAIELYRKLKVTLSWQVRTALKLVPDSIEHKFIKSLIGKLCGKAKAIVE